MKTSSGMSGIVGNIMASHDIRMKSINDLVKGTTEMLGRFRQERADADIKGCLKEGDKARLAGFGEMMSGINKSIADICGEVSALKSQANSMVKDFQKAHQAMAKKLKNDFAESKEARAEGEKARMVGFGELMSNINKSIADVQKEVSDLSDTTQAMMKGYSEERKQMAADWADMERVISGKGRGAAAPAVKKAEPAKVVAPKPVAPAVKKAEPAKVVAPKAKAPVAAKKTVAPKTGKKVKIHSSVKKG